MLELVLALAVVAVVLGLGRPALKARSERKRQQEQERLKSKTAQSVKEAVEMLLVDRALAEDFYTQLGDDLRDNNRHQLRSPQEAVFEVEEER